MISWVKIHTKKEMLAYAISKVHQREIAEDLVQDTFFVWISS